MNTTHSPSPDKPTRTSSSSRRGRVAPLVAVVGATAFAAIALTGCASGVEAFKSAVGAQQVQQRHYDRWNVAPTHATSTDLAWFLPSWVPSDATDIDVRLDTEKPGYEIAFTSTTGVDPARCTPVDGDLGGPALTPDVLPTTLPHTGLVSCGDGRVTAEVDGRWYGWTTLEPVPGDDGATTLRSDGTPAS
ncbi:hypothetical protein ACPEEZ_12830 [Frigoribacterium sp. 2-23]|uniref:hypothetical protein n=1 Tax=Frigoribacterium sp. 2-23 TaxID=3415006 RepID=UPI003C6F4AAC